MIIELGTATVATKSVQPTGVIMDPSPLPASWQEVPGRPRHVK
jgi:hypothetical protein